jgi:hypothetical protein
MFLLMHRFVNSRGPIFSSRSPEELGDPRFRTVWADGPPHPLGDFDAHKDARLGQRETNSRSFQRLDELFVERRVRRSPAGRPPFAVELGVLFGDGHGEVALRVDVHVGDDRF